MNETQLVQRIKAHIAKGDQAAEKSAQHYISAGQHLKTLKAQHGGSWAEWEELLKTKIGIGKSRASELMQIADGRKSVEEIRANTAERTARMRALQSSALSPLRDGETPTLSANRRAKLSQATCDECGEAAVWVACPDCGGRVLHIPTGKRVTMATARLIAAHYGRAGK